MTHTTPRMRPIRGTGSRRYCRAAHLFLEPLEPRTLFSGTPAASPADLVAQANNAFAFDLYQELRKTNTGNLFFSPYSIATALEMTLQGARGQTAAEMIQALHLPSQDMAQAGIQSLYQLFQADPATSGYTLSTANRLWVNDHFPLLQSFLTDTQNLFGAGAQAVDFSNPDAAAATINAWVSEQTHGKIAELISARDVGSFTALVLTNAIYFKGDWTNAFDAYGTHDATFHITADQVMTVNMMHQTSYLGYYSQSGPNGFQAVDLPYKGGNLDMLVILPNASPLDGFSSTFTPGLFSQITANLQTTDVDLSLPKFTLNETYNLNTSLQDLGIHGAFDPLYANLSGIGPGRLFVSNVVQNSFVSVDESGTEASAATGGVVSIDGILGNPAPPVLFNADHPFFMAIRDRSTNTILFMGSVTDPGHDPSANSPPPSGAGINFPFQHPPVTPTIPGAPVATPTSPNPSPSDPTSAPTSSNPTSAPTSTDLGASPGAVVVSLAPAVIATANAAVAPDLAADAVACTGVVPVTSAGTVLVARAPAKNPTSALVPASNNVSLSAITANAAASLEGASLTDPLLA